MKIKISDYAVTLQRKPVKNINLRIKRSGEVQVSAPIRTPLEVIYRFLHNKRTWIETHRERFLQREQTTHRHLNSQSLIPFQGKQLEILVHHAEKHSQVELIGNQLQFFIKPNATESDKEQLLTQWYRLEMEKILPNLLSKWQTIMGVSINKVTIKSMKSRWGSCHPFQKNITLNLKLIEKPLICLEYVIVHELVHLFEASHNKRFYALMSQYLPEWKQIKKQLNLE